MKKICTNCKEEKDISEFHKNKTGKFGVRSDCKLCTKKYYEENKDKKRRYQKQNKEKILKQKKKYYEENKNKILEIRKKYYEENKDKIAKAMKNHYEQNKDKILKRNSKYIKTEAGRLAKARVRHKRRAQEKNTVCDLTIEQWHEILEIQDNKCNMCFRKFNKKLKPERDHIIPLSLGGGLTFLNVQALCKSCNSRKGNR